MATYLENYLESISTLPAELNRNFALVRELDDKAEVIINKIEDFIDSYQKGDTSGSNALSREDIDSLRDELKVACTYGDEKVSLTIQTYELVDKHIRRLDQDLRKFEHEIEMQKKQLSSQAPYSYEPVEKKMESKNANKKRDRPGPGRPRKYLKEDDNTDQTPFEMPIDPNEPTYCTCNRVSFGEMIGCDNPDCLIEWFHFECVGLTSSVKGKWYCDACKEKMKKK